MLIFEKDDRKIISHLRCVGLYDQLMRCEIPPDAGPCPTIVYRTAADVYIRFEGRERAEDNGLLWLHLDHATPAEYERAALFLLSILQTAPAGQAASAGVKKKAAHIQPGAG